MENTQTKNNFDVFLNLFQKSKENLKSIEASKQLNLLNTLADVRLGKILQVLEKATHVKKCSYSFYGYTSNDGSKHLDFQHYGHLVINDNEKFYRLSTCLNKQAFNIQIPAYEKQYWNDKTYLCFTTGDFFLTIKTSDLLDGTINTLTEKGNLEYYIWDLISKNKIRDFGYIDEAEVMESSQGIFDLKTVKLLDQFYNFNIRGCITSLYPKYALRYAKSKDIGYYSSIEAIKNAYPSIKFTRQYLARMAKNNFSTRFDNPKTLKIDDEEYVLYCIKGTKVEDFVKLFDNIVFGTRSLPPLDDITELTYEEAKEFIKRKNSSLIITDYDISKITKIFGRITQETCNEAIELRQIGYG